MKRFAIYELRKNNTMTKYLIDLGQPLAVVLTAIDWLKSEGFTMELVGFTYD